MRAMHPHCSRASSDPLYAVWEFEQVSPILYSYLKVFRSICCARLTHLTTFQGHPPSVSINGPRHPQSHTPLAPADVNRLIANFLALRVHHRYILDAPHLDLSGLLPPSPLTKRVILNLCFLHPWTWIVLIANFLALGVMALVVDLLGTRISYCITLSLNSNSRRRSYVRLPMAQHPRSISVAAFMFLLHRHLLPLAFVHVRPDFLPILQVANRLG